MIKESDSVCELVSDDNFVITDKNSLNRPDPVRQICDIPVKIADLGNACWTVSGRERERERYSIDERERRKEFVMGFCGFISLH